MHAAEDHVLGRRTGSRVLGQLERIASDVRERDDLVALIVVAEYEGTVAKLGPGPLRTAHQRGIGRRRQVAGAGDATLAAAVGFGTQDEQRQPLTGLRGRGCWRSDGELAWRP